MPTCYLAPVDASKAERDRADFKCSGQHDAVQLRLADRQASAVFGVVDVATGTLDPGDHLTLNTTFDGQGARQQWAKKGGTKVTMGKNTLTLRQKGNVKHMTLRGDAGNKPTDKPTLLVEALGKKQFYAMLDLLQGIYVVNPNDDMTGYGIKFEGISASDGSRSYNFNHIGPIMVRGYKRGFWVYIEKKGGSSTAWNENTLQGGYFSKCMEYIRVEAVGTPWVGVNNYLDIYMDGYRGTKKGIEFVGGEGRNRIRAHAQDWHNCLDAPTVILPYGSVYNNANILTRNPDIPFEDNSGNDTNLITVNNQAYRGGKKVDTNLKGIYHIEPFTEA